MQCAPWDRACVCASYSAHSHRSSASAVGTIFRKGVSNKVRAGRAERSFVFICIMTVAVFIFYNTTTSRLDDG